MHAFKKNTSSGEDKNLKYLVDGVILPVLHYYSLFTLFL